MSFDYNKIKTKAQDAENQWTSNSDLFMVLSLVFLLLFVVSSLRNGSNSVQKSIQYQQLKKRNQDLEQQILAYETLKEDYMKKQASAQEEKMYENLMEKLSLLKEEAEEEKNELRKRALENEQKEQALNQYQQMIRNIINTNMLAKQRIKRRNQVIEKKDIKIAERDKTIVENNKVITEQKRDIAQKEKTIEEKKKIIEEKKKILAQKRVEIQDLKEDIKVKEDTIKANNEKIAQINKDLDEQIKKLNEEYKRNKKNKKILTQKIQKLKKISAAKISKLKKLNFATNSKLEQVNNNLSTVESQLNNANNLISMQQQEKLRLTSEVEKMNQELKQAQAEYNSKVAELKSEHEAKMKAEKAAFEKNLKKQKLSAREQKRRLAEFQKRAKEKEDELAGKIAALDTTIKDVSGKLSQAESEKEKLAQSLADTNEKYQQEMAKMQSEHDAKMKAEKAAFEKGLAKQRLSAAAKAKKLAAFQKEMAAKKAALQGKLGELSAKLAQGQAELAAKEAAAKQAEGRYLASIDNLKNKNQELSGDLAKAKKNIDARKKLAKKMMDVFKKKGIKASVDGKTGDVTINFGDEYFDAGATFLKKGMKQSLHKFMPSYTESLFSDPEIAKNIENVEIIGFASPTFNGRFINPKSIDPKDQKALKYNLKLSQGRANSVFNYIVDQKKLKYKHQKALVPLIKVSGRSFLTSEIKDPEKYHGMSSKEFCKKYDCNKSQRVIVKFSLKN